MNHQKKSLYLILSAIIVLTVVLIISIHSVFSYINTKNSIIDNIKKESNNISIQLKKNISNLIESYSIHEYEKLLHNQMYSNEILFALIVKDYNMGKLQGKEYTVSGKIRDVNGNILEFDDENKTHKDLISKIYYEKSFDITNQKEEKIGSITIYISDKMLNKELEEIVFDYIIEATSISLLLIFSLLLTIRYFILKPIYNMIKVINDANKDGIPTKEFSSSGSKEIYTLSNTMNNMIKSIRTSQNILKQNENKLRSLLEMSPIAVRIATNHGEKIVFANSAYLKLLHVDKKKLLEKNPKTYYLNESIYQDILNSLDNNVKIENKLISLNINGNEIWVMASYMNIEYDNEKAVIGWFYDITEKIQIQKQIEEQKNEFETIFNYSIDGLAIVDLESNFLEFNSAYMKMTGFTREELLKTSCINLTSPKDLPRVKEALEHVLEKGFVVDFEKVCIVKENKNLTVNMSMILLPDKKRILFSVKDVSQHKLMESQSKLASMGEMIGNIAHQWRQPLSLISTIASGIKVQIEFGLFNEKDVIPNMNNIIQQTTYLSNTIDDFRNFIKNSNEKGEVLISNVIKKALSILNASAVNNNIIIILNTKEDVSILGYENQLIQALINILNNAKDALKENVKNSEDRLIFIETENIQDSFVLKIKDNAGGIPQNIIDKIFEPYFTTKHQSIGTGIGLSITHQIITNHHNANIFASNETYEYENKTYTGACFTITFNKNVHLEESEIKENI